MKKKVDGARKDEREEEELREKWEQKIAKEQEEEELRKEKEDKAK